MYTWQSGTYNDLLSHMLSLTWVTDQAPVSDREYRATLPETSATIDLAAKMITEGRGMELMPREANPDAPITAYRWTTQQFHICLCSIWLC